MNSSMFNHTDLVSDYEHHGAVIYTIVTLLFYSLSLFCSLILNIDQDDDYYGKKCAVYQHSQQRRASHSNQTDVLNALLDQSLRNKYWRIYYGDEEFESRSNQFVSNETKRLSTVSQRMKELNSEQIKQSSKHQELEELNRVKTNKSPPILLSPPRSPFSFKFRRSRSISNPNASLSDEPMTHRSYDVLCRTPLCKPPALSLTKHS